MEAGSPAGGAVARFGAAAARAAANPTGSRMRLWLLGIFFGGGREVAGALAANPATPVALLRYVARRSLKRGHWNVAVTASNHPACSERLYRRLLVSGVPAVECAAAANPRVSTLLEERLERFAEPWLRLHMALNPAAPAELADTLLVDEDPFVRRVAAAHPAVTADGLRRVCMDFAQPAWILRAAATNPACPPDLADQLLTWIALGGAGASDPHFDPITCIGNPNSTEVHPGIWYANAARQEGAETHALWRVRATIPIARQRIPIAILTLLARDPRPEVRRQAARFRALPFPVLRELRCDKDENVERLAESALKDKPRQLGRRLQRSAFRVIPVAAVVLLVNFFVNNPATPSIPEAPASGTSDSSGRTGPSTTVPGGSTSPSTTVPTSPSTTVPDGSVQIADGFSLPATIAATRKVAGGGEIQSGTFNLSTSLPNLPFVSVSAGTVPLVVTVPGAFSFGATLTQDSGPLQIPAYDQMVLVLPDDPTSVDVTVLTANEPSVTLDLGFDVANP